MSLKTAQPIPHLVIDNFFPPAELGPVERLWPHPGHDSWYQMKSFREDKWATKDVGLLPVEIREFLRSLNSSEFIRYLEKRTGIQGLIPDPHFHGGGLHEIHQGGFLKMHRDFNWHTGLQLVRRVNVLLYLNPHWEREWGGHLKLEGQCLIKMIVPRYNRLVIMDTQAPGFHGHPDPLRTPRGISRRSIAAYYYTAGKVTAERGTEYHEQVPGEFHLKARDRVEAFAKAWCPPELLKLKRRIIG